MSLILEALRKLEGEKAAPARGFVVVGSPGWPAPRRSRGGLVVAVVGSLVVAAVALGLLLARRPAAPGPASRPYSVPARSSPVARVPGSPTPTADQAGRQSSAPSMAGDAAPSTPASATAPPGTLTAVPRAPTTSAASSDPAAPAGLVLEAIGERDGRRVAILSGHLVREGDSLEGARILRIGETEVELDRDGRRILLRF